MDTQDALQELIDDTNDVDSLERGTVEQNSDTQQPTVPYLGLNGEITSVDQCERLHQLAHEAVRSGPGENSEPSA